MIPRLVLVLTVSLAGCGPTLSTGDLLADAVVASETGSPPPCVALGGPTPIFARDETGPPAMLQPGSFRDPEARQAASRIQVAWRDAPAPTYETVGVEIGGGCIMQVNRASMSGDFAFVGFSDPGGELGAYVFRRSAGEWRVVEKVVRGYW
jgi:hypothetical protein